MTDVRVPIMTGLLYVSFRCMPSVFLYQQLLLFLAWRLLMFTKVAGTVMLLVTDTEIQLIRSIKNG